MLYDGEIDLADLLARLKAEGIDRVTVQSGGSLNPAPTRSQLIDLVTLVTAPLLVGGKDIAMLADGQSFVTSAGLKLPGLTIRGGRGSAGPGAVFALQRQ